MCLEEWWNDFKSQCSHECTRFQVSRENNHYLLSISSFSAVKMKMIHALSKPWKSTIHQILKPNTHTNID